MPTRKQIVHGIGWALVVVVVAVMGVAVVDSMEPPSPKPSPVVAAKPTSVASRVDPKPADSPRRVTDVKCKDGWIFWTTYKDVRSVRTTLGGSTIVVDNKGVEHKHPITQPCNQSARTE